MGGFKALIEKFLHADPVGQSPYITGGISLFFIVTANSRRGENGKDSLLFLFSVFG